MANKYDIVKEGLKKLILSGDYEVNDRLPTESELMAEYGVSRYTIRRAMQDLEVDHYIYRIQGGGGCSSMIDGIQNPPSRVIAISV